MNDRSFVYTCMSYYKCTMHCVRIGSRRVCKCCRQLQDVARLRCRSQHLVLPHQYRPQLVIDIGTKASSSEIGEPCIGSDVATPSSYLDIVIVVVVVEEEEEERRERVKESERASDRQRERDTHLNGALLEWDANILLCLSSSSSSSSPLLCV